MSVFVFLGPTLPVAEARAILDATYLPPVSMGDVCALMERKPRAIAIIDGLFERVPSVWHKEILYALSRGVRVFGSSSMGALRAAELHAFGMEGVGKIYEAFRDGVLEDDDEVAVVHGPQEFGYRSMSEAMVNIREGLGRAEDKGFLSSGSHGALLGAAKERFYPERSWENLFEDGRKLGLPAAELEALEDYVRCHPPNVKREDAVRLLEVLAEERRSGLEPHQPTFRFEPTFYWAKLVEREARPDDLQGADFLREEGASREAVRRHVRLTMEEKEEILSSCLLHLLVSREARRLGLEADPARLERAAARLAGSEGRQPSARDEDLMKVAELDVLRAAMLAHYQEEIDRFLLGELRRRGRLGEIVKTVAAKWRYLRQNGVLRPSLRDSGIDVDELIRWYEGRFGSSELFSDTELVEVGLESWEEVISELVAEYLFEEGKKTAGRKPLSAGEL